MAFPTTPPSSRGSVQHIGPKVRAACEACHQRKIRCQMLTDRSICQACDTSGRKCFFTLRAKAGRPRLSRNHSSDRGALSSEPSLRLDEYESWSDNNGKDKTLPMDLSMEFDWAELSNIESTNFFNEGCSPTMTDLYNNFPSYCSEQDDSSIDRSSSSTGLFRTGSTLSSDSYISSSIPHGSSISTEFTTTLHTCSGLQNMYQNIGALDLRAGHLIALSNTRLQSILQGLDAAGEAIVNTVANTSNNRAEASSSITSLVTLVVATLLKMLEICGALIQSSTPNIQTLSQVQLLKRVDFNIMQARTALRQLAHYHPPFANITMEVSSLASRLHKEIKVGLDGLPAELGGV